MIDPAIKTLATLKALPVADQSLILLRKLEHIYPMVKSAGGLHKGNLMGPNDPYRLAAEFPISENLQVREHFLGTPWTRLVNEGYLLDTRGSGFYSVSEEGLSAAKKTVESISRPDPGTSNDAAAGDAPSVFISYSWDSQDHKDWVLRLAERLQEDGVSVILDQWYLLPGKDQTHFMESSINDCDFVLVICTPEYATKSNARRGGASYEAMIITSHLAANILQDKFIPILRTGDWGDKSQPTWIRSKTGGQFKSGSPRRNTI